MSVANDQLVIEAKGIYSIEKFIIARRLMYWQVYLHKTVLSAENLLVNILKRAKELAVKKVDLFATPALKEFLYNKHTKANFAKNTELLNIFAQLDDNDIMASIKVWTKHPDFILSKLCEKIINRHLYKIELQNQPFKEAQVKDIKEKVKKKYKVSDKDLDYFVFSGIVKNDAYRADEIRINILFKDGSVTDIADASDQLNIDVLAKTVRKHYLCYPKDLHL